MNKEQGEVVKEIIKTILKGRNITIDNEAYLNELSVFAPEGLKNVAQALTDKFHIIPKTDANFIVIDKRKDSPDEWVDATDDYNFVARHGDCPIKLKWRK